MGIQDWLENYFKICRESEEKYRQARDRYYFCCWLEDYLSKKSNYFLNHDRREDSLSVGVALRKLRQGQLLEKKKAMDKAREKCLSDEKTLQARIEMARKKIKRIRNNKI